jgi:pilus assembly protein Flp/PilA
MMGSNAGTMARGESGASAVEYGLLVVGIAAVIVLIVFNMGGLVNSTFAGTCDQVKTQISTAKSCG